MTELQALAISSRFASSGYWFSMKKLGETNIHRSAETSTSELSRFRKKRNGIKYDETSF